MYDYTKIMPGELQTYRNDYSRYNGAKKLRFINRETKTGFESGAKKSAVKEKHSCCT